MTTTELNEKQVKYYTTYSKAIYWLHNSFIMCNNITDIDQSVCDNCRFNMYNEEDDTYMDIFQWFITDCSESDVEYLEKSFGLLFTYSDLLDKYILCVNHCGTSWDYVACPVYDWEYTPNIEEYKEN